MSKTALLKITDNKRNQRQKLPLAADLIALRDFLLKQIRKLTSVLMVQRTNPVVWTALSRLILVRIVVLNKRRSGEASKMLLADYVDRPKCSDPDVLHQLTAVEFVCWSLTSLCHSNGHIETMPAREINSLYCPDQDSIPVSQDTMIDEQSQRVDTTTP